MRQTTLLEKTLDDKFRDFHEANPKVYEMLEEMAIDLHNRGKTKIGIGMLFEVLRWKSMVKTTSDDYKLNNSYRSRYARMIIDNNPKLVNLFETRMLHS